MVKDTPSNRFSFTVRYSLARLRLVSQGGLHLSTYINMFIEFILLALAYDLHARVIPTLACAFLACMHTFANCCAHV